MCGKNLTSGNALNTSNFSRLCPSDISEHSDFASSTHWKFCLYEDFSISWSICCIQLRGHTCPSKVILGACAKPASFQMTLSDLTLPLEAAGQRQTVTLSPGSWPSSVLFSCKCLCWWKEVGAENICCGSRTTSDENVEPFCSFFLQVFHVAAAVRES